MPGSFFHSASVGGWLAGAIAVLVLASAARAQPTTGELAGAVFDAVGPAAAGVVLELAGPQVKRETLTGTDGSYVFKLLPVGSYQLVVLLKNHVEMTFEGIEVRRGERSRFDVTLPPEVEASIVVTGDSPAVDVTRTDIRTDVGTDLLERVPVGRSIGDAVGLAAGVNSSAGGTGASPGNQNPSIGGASGLENAYVIDGVNVSDAGYGGLGAYSFRHASSGTAVPFDFVESLDVISGGFGVEYGQAMGGVINVLTRSGANTLRGSAFAYASPDSLRATRREPDLDNRSIHKIVEVDEWDLGFVLSGPVVEDRLFFFGAYNPQSRTEIKRPDPDSELAPQGDREMETFRHAYSAKLSWNLAPSHQLVLSVFGDTGSTDLGPQLDHPTNFNENPNYESRLDFGFDAQVAHYTGVLTDSLTVEAQLSRSSTDFDERLPTAWDRHFLLDLSSPEAGVSGGPGYYETTEGETLQAKVKATKYFAAHGGHALTIGASLDEVDYLGNFDYSGPPGVRFFDASGSEQTYETGLAVLNLVIPTGPNVLRDLYLVVQGFLSPAIQDTTTERLALFVEDRWYPTPNLTVVAGIRAERQEIQGGGEPQVLPDGTLVQPQRHEFHLEDHIAPRLGLSWDFTGEGRGRLFFNVGRFFAPLSNSFAANILSPGVQGINVFYDVQSGLGLEENLDPAYQTFDFGPPVFFASGEEVLPDTKLQYQDEAIVGAEYGVSNDLTLGARYVYRKLGRAIEDFSLIPNEVFTAGGAETQSLLAGNPGKRLNPTCPAEHPNCWVDPKRRYDALEITARRRFADGWQLLGSYRWSRLRGNYEGLFSTATGLPGNASTIFDFPNNTDYTEEELQTICGGAPDFGSCVAGLPPGMFNQGKTRNLPSDRRHLLQVAGSYQPRSRLGLGGNLRAANGLPRIRYNSGGYFPGNVPVGTDGRTSWTWGLDLHTDYRIRLGPSVEGILVFDVFNVTGNERIVAYDPYQDTFLAQNSDFGRPFAWQPPRSVRLGFRIQFEGQGR